VAHGLAAASLCFAAIGCGDDTGADMAVDMTARDMTAIPQDMAMDMTMPPSPPSAAVIVGDIVGVVHQDVPDGGEVVLPCKAASCGGVVEFLTHRLLPVTNFPMAGGAPSDFSNLNINAGTLTISGCVANRYDLTSATGHHPTPDVNVGTVSLGAISMNSVTASGWNATRFAASAEAPTAQNNVFGLPLPAGATCAVGTSGFYSCTFKGAIGTTTPITAAGYHPGAAVFPALPKTPPAGNPMAPSWLGLCVNFTQATPNPTACITGTDAACAACLAACDDSKITGVCEQHLFYPTTHDADAGTGGTTIGVDVPGAAPYGAATKSIDVPPGPFVTDIKVGGVAICTSTASAPCSMNSLDGHFDATKDLTIDFSCDPANPLTAGAGCTTQGPFDLFVMAGATSLHDRGAYSASDLKQGTLTCLEQAKNATHSVTVPTAALTAMIGGQSGGAITLNLLRVKGTLGAGTNELFMAGNGSFVFINLP